MLIKPLVVFILSFAIILAGCENDSNIETYNVYKIRCFMGGNEPEVFVFEDSKEKYHNFYVHGGGLINIGVRYYANSEKNEEHYITGNCHFRRFTKTVTINNIPSIEEKR